MRGGTAGDQRDPATLRSEGRWAARRAGIGPALADAEVRRSYLPAYAGRVAFALLSAALFGAMNVLVKRAQRARPLPDGGLLVTVVLNAAILSLLVGIQLPLGVHPLLNPGGVAVFVLAGLLTTYLGRRLQFATIHRIGPGRAAGYRITSPAFTMVLAVAFLEEQLGPGALGGVVIAIVGLWLLTSASAANLSASSAPGRAERSGPILGLLAAASFGAGHAARKGGLSLIPSPYLGAWIGSIVALVASIAQLRSRGQLGATLAAALRPIEWNLVTAGVLSGAAQLALYISFYYAPVSLASALSATEPLFTVALARFLLPADQGVPPLGVLGILITIAGVVMILLLQGT